MAKIENLDDFNNLTSNITSFSHAYLFNVNSLSLAYPYIKEFAKRIIGESIKLADIKEIQEDINYQIDNEEYDDFYVVNPQTIGINTEEIEKLLHYMQTKSIHSNGRRIYVIYGFERLSREVSNKILKFLEEPNDDIYALLMTEDIDKVLSTIISRCQVINLTFNKEEINKENIQQMHVFFNNLYQRREKNIAYAYDFWKDLFINRIAFFDGFCILENIIANTINQKIGAEYQNEYVNDIFLELPLSSLVNILNITNKLKTLIKKNINLNLLLDRYIIEISEELNLCKK